MQQLADIQQINHSIMFGNFTNEQLDSVTSAVKFARSLLSRFNKRQLRIGTTVKWTNSRTGRMETGAVEKIAIKFVTVNTGAMRWKVPANMLKVA